MLTTLVDELLRSGKKVRFRAPGHSMSPLIRSNEILIVQPIDPRDVRKGDILLYRSADRLTAHRLVAAVPGPGGEVRQLTLRSDAWPSVDEHVLPAQVLGKVVAVERKSGPFDPYGRKTVLLNLPRKVLSKIRRRLKRLIPPPALS